MPRGVLIKLIRYVVSTEEYAVLLAEQSTAYYKFINSLHTDSTKQSYKYCLEKFLNHYRIDLL